MIASQDDDVDKGFSRVEAVRSLLILPIEREEWLPTTVTRMGVFV